MRFYREFLLGLFLLLAANSAMSQCAPACTDTDACFHKFTIGRKTVDYYSSFPLNNLNDCVDEVIFIVHGTERNPRSRYQAAVNAARNAGVLNNVLIISPFFKTEEDDPDEDEYYWSNAGWRQGNYSINSGSDVSAFSVADRFLSSVFTNEFFPNINKAVVTGHSAGGQYAQMYALTSTNIETFPNINFRFLVLNPSNYTYLNDQRPHPDYFGHFETPVYLSGSSLRMKPIFRESAGNCPNTYNDYKYGLNDLNDYAGRSTKSELIAQYINRNVYYFVGEIDNVEDDLLDTSCSATIQGDNRLERGANYFAFINTQFAPHHHNFGIVPGVGHDARDMYDSDKVKAAMFQWTLGIKRSPKTLKRQPRST